MTKAIVYARVSTDDQADKGFSLSAQVEAGRKYAESHAMTVSQELIDDGVSGAMAFSERPAGAVAYALLRSGKADALIVQNVDRLSRDVVDLLVTIRALLRAGVEVHCLDLGRVTSEYDIVLMIRGWQSGDEREKIKRRSMRGKREKLAQGMIVGGRLPYGYDHLRDGSGRAVNFTVNADQAAIVRLIFQWYTAGCENSGPLALYDIAQRLTAAGIPTPAAQVWSMTPVSRIIQNPVYKGAWTYTASATDDAPEQTFVIAVPAIVDVATWDAAQVQMECNSRKAKRNGKRDFLLRGIIRCGTCGYVMAGNTIERGARFYYRCNTKAHSQRGVRCEQKSVKAEALEAAAWDGVKYIVNNSATLEADLRETQRQELAEQEPKRQELEAVNAMMAEAQAEAGSLAVAFAQLVELHQAKGPVGDALTEKISAVNDRHSRLTARRDELEAALANRHYTDEAIDTALQFMSDLREGVENAEAEDKRGMLDTLNACVIVEGDKARMEYRLTVLRSIDLHLRLQTLVNYITLSIDLDLSPYLAAIPTATATVR